MKTYNCSVIGTFEKVIANSFDIYVAEDKYIARGLAESHFNKSFPEYNIEFTIIDSLKIELEANTILITTEQVL